MNEALFRSVNERIQDVADAFQLTTEPLDLLCECGDAKCVQRIKLTRTSYEQLRADPHLFAVSPGHDAPDVEEVVENGAGYDIVRKHAGVPEELAEQSDPRS